MNQDRKTIAAFIAFVALIFCVAKDTSATDTCEASHLSRISMRINEVSGELETKWLLSIVNCKKTHGSGMIMYELMCPDVDGQMYKKSERHLAWDMQNPNSPLEIADSIAVPSEECRAENGKVEVCQCDTP